MSEVVPIIFTVILFASVLALVDRRARLAGFRLGCVTVAANVNEALARDLPAQIRAAEYRGGCHVIDIMLPLLTAHGLQYEAIQMLAGKRDELAAKGERN